MKKNILLFSFLVILLGIFSTTWGDLITIGDSNATTNDQIPINRFYNYSTYEMLYTSSEIGAPYIINKVAFYKYSGSTTVTINNVSIYMMILQCFLFAYNYSIFSLYRLFSCLFWIIS